VIRGQKVLLDQEVAKIYSVQTMRINEAVRNNGDSGTKIGLPQKSAKSAKIISAFLAP
jgi:hypothetical protein